MASVNIVHVPYKAGGPQVLQDVVAGEVAMLFGNIVSTTPFVRSGRSRALAVSSAKRASSLPDIPTVAESGLPGFEAVAWFAITAPAGTAQSITTKIHQEAMRVLAQPEVRNRMAGLGAEVIGNSPEEFVAQVRAEISRKGKIVKDAGIKPN
jgi:tripartite-type tricarboxylate transporter receptor subunit TctC